MSILLAILLLLSVVGFAGGQILLKSALAPPKSHFSRSTFTIRFVGAIALMTVSFFVSLGLLQRFDLSYLYPFQGLNVLIITAGSALFLQEKLTLRLYAAILIITVGVALVSTS